MNSSNEFYGGLIGKSTPFTDKIFLFEINEKVLIGSNTSCDVVIDGKNDNHVYCQIEYDNDMEEYYVKPMDRKSVYLMSGQPLGKDRTYCIPRGKTLFIDNVLNAFELA